MSCYFILLLLALVLILLMNDKIYQLDIYRHFISFNCLLILFILSVFRSVWVGIDYYLYYECYYDYNYQGMRASFIEPGYAIYTTIAQHFNSFYIIPAGVFFLGIISLFLLNKQFKVNTFCLLGFFILTGFFFQSFDILRQFMAISIVYIGIYLLFKFKDFKLLKYILYLVCILIAFNFHKSAIIGVIFLILPKIHISKNNVLYSTIITILLSLNKHIENIFSHLTVLVPYYNEKYNSNSHLANSSTFYINQSNSQILIKLIPIFIQLILLYLFVSNKNTNQKGSKLRFIESGYLSYLLISILIAFWGPGLRRLQLYWFLFPMFYSCIYMNSYTILNYSHNSSKNINTNTFMGKIIYLVVWIIIYVSKLIIDNEKIVPYKFI